MITGRSEVYRGGALFRCCDRLEVDGFGGLVFALLILTLLLVVLGPLFEEDLLEGALAGGAVELGFGGDGAVEGVGDDLVDGFGGFGGGGFGQVEGGDLEAVEEQAGAFGVDVVGGDAAQDLADGDLDGGAVFGVGECEGGLFAASMLQILDGFTGFVVVVTK